MGGPEALASPACHDRNKSDPVGGTHLGSRRAIGCGCDVCDPQVTSEARNRDA